MKRERQPARKKYPRRFRDASGRWWLMGDGGSRTPAPLALSRRWNAEWESQR